MNPEGSFFNTLSDFFNTRRDNFGEIFVIGGYVRDKLLNKFNKDLDFVVKKNSLNAAREIADFFGGDFFILDRERETARALIQLESHQYIVDIALMNGENIIDDLTKRDFTINGMALNISEPDKIIDPLGGQKDLQNKKLVPCRESSFSDDPVRILRAVRFIQNLGLVISPKTKPAILAASKNLHFISAERIRDEVCQIIKLADISRSYELMSEYKVSALIFPSLEIINEIAPEFPHVHNALTHSFRVVELVRSLLDFIINSKQICENNYLNDVQKLIENYRDPLIEYLRTFNKLNSSICPLMALAGLYHDSAKSNISPFKEDGRIVYPNHALKSAEIVRVRMGALAFSNDDINFVATIIRYHMSEYFKSISIEENPNRKIYRYFLEAKDLGVLLGIFHLADLIATYENTLTQSRWKIAFESVERIFDVWFNRFREVISPAKLITGDELIEKLGLSPGRQIGRILESIREEQAAGSLSNKKMAFDFAKKMIVEMKNGYR